MKTFFLKLLLLMIPFCAWTQPPMITEIMYDNNVDQALGDIDGQERVEVYLPDPQPTDLTDWWITVYHEDSSDPTSAEFYHHRDLSIQQSFEKTPNGAYYTIIFQDSIFFGFPIGGLIDGGLAIALVEISSPNVVHDFWHIEQCDGYVAADGPAIGFTSAPITQDASRICGSPGASLVQMNSALPENMSIQQNGFGDWGLQIETSLSDPHENMGDQVSNVPISLLNFEIKKNYRNVIIDWTTGQEVNNKHFEILHSKDGNLFSVIGLVAGKGTYNGQSDYRYQVSDLSEGLHYFRLKQVDFDGHSESFEIKTVQIGAERNVSVFPTTSSNNIWLNEVEQGTNVIIYNLNGVKISEAPYEGNIEISHLEKGLHIIQADQHRLKFIKI